MHNVPNRQSHSKTDGSKKIEINIESNKLPSLIVDNDIEKVIESNELPSLIVEDNISDELTRAILKVVANH